VVVFDLLMDVLAGLGDDVAMVDVFDEGFEGERDEEADGDDDEMDEEVSPGVDWFVGA
jgi:hypothetical protein